MQCKACERSYSRIGNPPYIVCANKHTVCEVCLPNLYQGKAGTCTQCSDPLLAPRLCVVTLNNIAPSQLLELLSWVVAACMVGIVIKRQSPENEQQLSPFDFRYYFTAVASQFLVQQLLIIVCEVYPQIKWLRENPQKNKVGADYLAGVLLRQGLLWNWKRISVLGAIMMSARYVAFGMNARYIINNHSQFGAMMILSIVVNALSLAEVPVIKYLVLGVYRLINSILGSLVRGLSRGPQLFFGMIVYSIYLGIAVLIFLGYMYEVDLMNHVSETLRSLKFVYILPTTVIATLGFKHKMRWVVLGFYHHLALLATKYLRYFIIFDIILLAICVPKLIIAPFADTFIYASSQDLYDYRSLGIHIGGLLNALLTPLQISFFMLMGVANP